MARGIALNIGLNAVDPNHYRDGQGNPWPGTLAACENDARDMAALAGELGYEVRGPLLTSAAHSTAVMDQVRAAAAELDNGDIFFLTYSGHGGQVLNTNPDDDPEEDQLDETWCLFDRELLDDELFSLLSEFRSGVRVVVFSDSCHSGTAVRGRPPRDALPTARQLPVDVAEATEHANADLYDTLQKETPTKRLTSMSATVVLLSGCQDSQFSRDGDVNGAFTGSLLKAWQNPDARRSEIIVADPGREFAFATGGAAKPETVWRYALEPLGENETRVTESFQLVKPLGIASRFVTRITTGVRDRRADLEDNVRQSLVRIKEILEAGDGST